MRESSNAGVPWLLSHVNPLYGGCDAQQRLTVDLFRNQGNVASRSYVCAKEEIDAEPRFVFFQEILQRSQYHCGNCGSFFAAVGLTCWRTSVYPRLSCEMWRQARLSRLYEMKASKRGKVAMLCFSSKNNQLQLRLTVVASWQFNKSFKKNGWLGVFGRTLQAFSFPFGTLWTDCLLNKSVLHDHNIAPWIIISNNDYH